VIVEHAATIARGPVHVQACLGPGWEYAPIPLTEVEWAPVGVGADGQSLNVMYSWDVVFGLPPSLTLREFSREIQITVALPDLKRDPETTAFPLIAIGRLSRRLVVRVADPIGGRRITGASCLLASSESGIARDPVLQRHRDDSRVVLPNAVGLHPKDAESLLRLQGLASRVEGSGSEVTATDPAANGFVSRHRTIVLRTTPP
jgi:PASTA domain